MKGSVAELKSISSSKKLLIFLAVIAFFGALAVSLFIYLGGYNVSALTGHTAPVYKVLQFARMQSIKLRVPDEAPDLDQFDWRDSGMQIYEMHCLKCHGAPGLAPEAFALGMMPPPSAIAQVARSRTSEQLYWVINNGIMMSGMPAWKYRLKEHEMWELVAFLKKLPEFTAREYASLREQASERHESDHASQEAKTLAAPYQQKRFSGDEALQQYNCSSCHVIKGISSAVFDVGPPISEISQRSYIAGFLPYSRENLISWIMKPEQLKPNTLMPNLGVTQEHAEAMADYLEALSD